MSVKLFQVRLARGSAEFFNLLDMCHDMVEEREVMGRGREEETQSLQALLEELEKHKQQTKSAEEVESLIPLLCCAPSPPSRLVLLLLLSVLYFSSLVLSLPFSIRVRWCSTSAEISE